MNIRNATQFANFVSANGLTGLDNAFLEITLCMSHYSSACDCHNRTDKQNIYNNCHAQYINAVRGPVQRHKAAFLSKSGSTQMIFYADNGSIIGSIGR